MPHPRYSSHEIAERGRKLLKVDSEPCQHGKKIGRESGEIVARIAAKKGYERHKIQELLHLVTEEFDPKDLQEAKVYGRSCPDKIDIEVSLPHMITDDNGEK